MKSALVFSPKLSSRESTKICLYMELQEKLHARPTEKHVCNFCNLATETFAWVGAEEAEIVTLNDFQWKPSIIAWADMLLLLEGDIVDVEYSL